MSEEKIIKTIAWEVRARIMAKGSFQYYSRENEALCRN
jgi:hypothetical protein